MEVLVLRDEHALVFASELPNDRIWCSADPQLPDMKRLGKQITQQIDELLRQRLVEEQPHANHAAGTLSVRRSRSAA
jgi:hypothetical protein